MKSRKRGELTVVAASTDKHKLWLIIGIVLAVVLVLAIVFLSPARQALFGKAGTQLVNPSYPLTANPPTGTQTSGGTQATTDVARAGTGTISRAVTPCLNVQSLLANRLDTVYNDQNRRVTNPNERNYYIGLYRARVCTSVGCSFQGLESSDFNRAITYSLTNDRCVGTPAPNVCPLVSAFRVSGATGENSREVTCEQGFGISSLQTPTHCSFSNGKGDNTPTQDTCLPAAEIDALCSNDFDDDRDGVVDCADSDCTGVGVCASGTDTDNDGITDASEPEACRTMGSAGTVSSNGCPYGDENDDGCVNFDDIAQIAANVDFDCPSEGHEPVSGRAGDVNGDGCVNFDDVALIAQNVNFDCGGS